MQREREVFY